MSDGEPGRQSEAATEVEIRPIEETDLYRVVAIEREVYPAPWSYECFRNELSRRYSHLEGVHERATGRLIGYICYWILYNEMHILNLAVRPDRRGRGLGRLLLTHALDQARAKETTLVSLEVRASNEVALALYRSLGFRQVGVRPRYYSPEREDALLMQLTLT